MKEQSLNTDRVNLAAVSVHKVQEELPSESEDFSEILSLIITAHKQASRGKCTLCQLAKRRSDSQLESHHIAGREHLPDALTVCLPCHNELSEKQKKWQYNKHEPHIALSSYFHGLSDIFELLFERNKQDHLKALATEFRHKAWYIRNCTPPK